MKDPDDKLKKKWLKVLAIRKKKKVNSVLKKRRSWRKMKKAETFLKLSNLLSIYNKKNWISGCNYKETNIHYDFHYVSEQTGGIQDIVSSINYMYQMNFTWSADLPNDRC